MTSALALSVTVIGGPTPAANAAVGSPAGLSVSTVGASTPVLTWERAKRATEYQVQVDNDSGFGSPEFTTTTENNSAVPTRHLRPGTAHWRVRAIADKDSSDWVRGAFTVNAADVPAPVAPADGANLPQPQSAPLLRWTTSRGATSYVVEVDGDADFVGAKQYTTRSTSLVVPDPLGEGDWFWRVIADKGDGITSRPSNASSFNILALPSPKLTFPNDTFEEPIEDVVLDWEPVEGAQSYDLQVALDETFNNFALDVTGIRGSRYSPATTLFNDEFWWRVRAVDTAGLPTPWQKSRFSFKRVFPDVPVAQHPVGSAVAPGVQGVDTTYFSWTPVQHASNYEVQISNDISFGVTLALCETAGTTFTPREFSTGDCTVPADGSTYWWRVRPLDRPYEDGGLPGNFSTPQAFTRLAQPAVVNDPPANWLQVRGTGLKGAMSGTGISAVDKGCKSTPSVGYPESTTSYTKPSVCVFSATPVLSWERQANISFYRVWFAQDENFSTTELQPFETKNTIAALDFDTDRAQLSDNESGNPYYWYVQPCRADGCGPSPVSQHPGLSGAASFRKISPKITGLTTSSGSGNDISFFWNDYHDVNEGVLSYGERGTQSAHTYHIVVDNERGFSEPHLDEATVDQTTYTSAKKLYPEGKLFWRVQAIDTEKNPLTWSDPAELTKSSPSVTLRSPVGSAAVAGSTPLEWGAQAYASRYTVEVYRDGDLSFSEGNRVLSLTTRNASYAPENPFPASSTPYVWRVRRLDPSGNPGPWSAPEAFVSLGAAPQLLAPAAGRMHHGNDLVFAWSDVSGAASYEVFGSSTTGERFSAKTVASAYAPSKVEDGSWNWQVRAVDADGEALGTSAPSTFRVDGTPPTLVNIKGTKLAKKKKAKIVAKFSERVKGVSKKTVKLTKKGSKRSLKVKVKVKGTKVTIKPKVRLKKGKTYQLTWNHRRIKDLAGNKLVKPEKWKVEVE